MKISVIIPLYNKEHFVAKTLESVLSQTYQDFEVIIIDDGSTDHSVEVVSSYDDSRIKIIKQPNRGVSSARNHGIQIAKGEYISFLDADDIWYPTFLEEMLELTIQYPKYYFFCCAQKDRPIPTLPAGVSIIDDHCKYFYLYCTGSNIIKKEVLDQVGGFRENYQYGEDLDMWLRISCIYPTVYLNKDLMTYNHTTEGNLSKIFDINKTFPYWEWYSYRYIPKRSLYKYTTDRIIRIVSTFIEQKDYTNAFAFLMKCRGIYCIRPRLKVLWKILLKIS